MIYGVDAMKKAKNLPVAPRELYVGSNSHPIYHNTLHHMVSHPVEFHHQIQT